jgi:hypothetical protein
MYDRSELLVLFGSEPIVIVDEETGIYTYEKEDSHGYRLSMYIDVHEGSCNITLRHKDLVERVYDVGLSNVISITGKNDKLIIQQDGCEHPAILYFKPNYSLSFKSRDIIKEFF